MKTFNHKPPWTKAVKDNVIGTLGALWSRKRRRIKKIYSGLCVVGLFISWLSLVFNLSVFIVVVGKAKIEINPFWGIICSIFSFIGVLMYLFLFLDYFLVDNGDW